MEVCQWLFAMMAGWSFLVQRLHVSEYQLLGMGGSHTGRLLPSCPTCVTAPPPPILQHLVKALIVHCITAGVDGSSLVTRSQGPEGVEQGQSNSWKER